MVMVSWGPWRRPHALPKPCRLHLPNCLFVVSLPNYIRQFVHKPTFTPANFHTHTHSLLQQTRSGETHLYSSYATSLSTKLRFTLLHQTTRYTNDFFFAPFCRMTVRWQGVQVSHSQFPLTKCQATWIWGTHKPKAGGKGLQARRRRRGAGDGAGGAMGNARAGC